MGCVHVHCDARALSNKNYRISLKVLKGKSLASANQRLSNQPKPPKQERLMYLGRQRALMVMPARESGITF